jgi:UDP-2-acetamido-2-deoxy-ribo-hexuluronate aminotransferase
MSFQEQRREMRFIVVVDINQEKVLHSEQLKVTELVPADIEEYDSIIFYNITSETMIKFLFDQQVFLPVGVLCEHSSEMADFHIVPGFAGQLCDQVMLAMKQLSVSHVPCLDLVREHKILCTDPLVVLNQVIQTGSFIGGKVFEKAAEKFLHSTRRCIAVANGTDALEVTYRAISVESKVALVDQVVLVPSFTHLSTASAVLLAGLKVEYMDVPKNVCGRYIVNAACVAKGMHSNVIAIVGVSLFGLVPNWRAIREVLPLHVVLVEDAAQSFGSSGSLSVADISTASFYPAKILGGYGDGGAVFCDNKWEPIIRSITNHGIDADINIRLGRNSRMDGFQAMVLAEKLIHLPRILQARTHVADFYDQALSDLPDVILPVRKMGEICSQYTILVGPKVRDQLVTHLSSHGVDARVLYKTPCHKQLGLAGTTTSLPMTELVSEMVLSIPCFPFMLFTEMNFVAELIQSFYTV